MRSDPPFQPRPAIQVLRLVFSWWPYLLIAICVAGLAYRYWQFLRR
jgi:hypothetical protein